MTTRPLDPVLARQLKRLTLPSEFEASPSWEKFIDSVNEHYLHTGEDRALLSRSIELSTQEMDGLRHRVESQRDRLLSIIGRISDSLAHFASGLQREPEGDNVQSTASAAKVELASRLQTILDESRLADERGSEVGGIRDNLLKLADQIITLQSEASERAGMRKALEVARAVQQVLIPAEAVVDIHPMRYVGYFEPADECGGDWWTVAPLPGGRSLAVLGDVEGHGVSSAIITGAAKAITEAAVYLTGGQLTASSLLALINRTLLAMTRQQISMTAVAAVLDPTERTLRLANAGHPFPVLVRKGITHPLMAEGPTLGTSAEASYSDTRVEIQPGDLLVCFSDGVAECENDKAERFTERRLRTIAQRLASSGAVKVRDGLVEALNTFRGSHPANDDITLLISSFQ
ncbi:MAG: PP2C family protein-serine/threonine phosphatase [Kofleriaceae bacterium]